MSAHDTTVLAAGTHVNGVELSIVVFFFVVVSAGGFLAARWRRADDPQSLEEWGLGGRSFGTVITWFLLGGDLYTAYTFVAVPAAMFGTGAISGFFAVPYTILVYPIIFVFMPRLWSVAHKHNWVTPADFIRGRYDSRALATAVAITGILATMPYIALQLVGIQAVLDTIGLGGSGNTFLADLPLFIAFAVLAAYTYSSGLRAPALIAFVKDTLIYLVIVVAVVYIGVKIGYGTMFTAAKTKLTTPGPTGKAPGVFHPVAQHVPGLLHLGARVVAGTFHVPALDDRVVVREEPGHHPAQRRDPAPLLADAGVPGPHRVRGRGQ